MKVTALTPDRRLITVDRETLLDLCPWYTLARDGVWVPRCDLRQYEAGRRPVRVDAEPSALLDSDLELCELADPADFE